MAGHVYSSGFYDYIDRGSTASARVVARLMLGEMGIDSLLDVGAGHGAWAAAWLAAGVRDVVAVDGDYVARDRLAIPAENFRPHDLTEQLSLDRKFDLVQSLEVAEHLPEHLADRFVDSLADHGDVVLFSAAVPHQGGEHHVNEQPPEYWRRRFARRGYAAYDWLRPRLRHEREVKRWYRFNSVIYANAGGAARLSPAIRATRVDDGRRLRETGDLGWYARRGLVWLLPSKLVEPVAMANSWIENRIRRTARG
jgi:SAM-dependent methyltransferase